MARLDPKVLSHQAKYLAQVMEELWITRRYSGRYFFRGKNHGRRHAGRGSPQKSSSDFRRQKKGSIRKRCPPGELSLTGRRPIVSRHFPSSLSCTHHYCVGRSFNYMKKLPNDVGNRKLWHDRYWTTYLAQRSTPQGRHTRWSPSF